MSINDPNTHSLTHSQRSGTPLDENLFHETSKLFSDFTLHAEWIITIDFVSITICEKVLNKWWGMT
jgi:hypothetical protein